MSEAEGVLMGILGYAMQWLRGFKWFNDGVTLLVCVVAGVLATLLAGGAVLQNPAAFVLSALKSALAFLGGTMLGHMAAQTGSPVMLAPKFNQFQENK